MPSTATGWGGARCWMRGGPKLHGVGVAPGNITMCQGLPIYTCYQTREKQTLGHIAWPSESQHLVCTPFVVPLPTPTSSLQPIRHSTQNWVPTFQWRGWSLQ